MIDIIFENRNLKFTDLSASDFNDYNLSYDEEAGTVTFKGYVFKVNDPYRVYGYIKEKERFTDPKTRVLVEIRISPKGQVFARRQYFKSASAYRFAKLMERGVSSTQQYDHINYTNEDANEDLYEYWGRNLGYAVR